LTIGFPQWDGYSVYQDPVFVSYISNSGGTPGDLTFGSLSINPDPPQPNEEVQIGIDISTSEAIYEVKLQYTTDFENWYEVGMYHIGGNRYEALIPGFEDGTTVFFKFIVTTELNTYESGVSQYTVGEAVTTDTTTTGPTPPGPGPLPISGELIILLGGGALVVIILIILSRRRKSSYTV
jgi:hypothetical protein